MGRTSGRYKNYLPTVLAESLAPINVFCVEEESLVQSADLLDGLAARHPEATT
jgi:hypothetical protein